MRLLFAMFVFSCAAFPQASAPTPPMTDEEFAAVCTRISQRAGQIEPMLQQLHPKDWMAKGAPDTYVAQWTTIVDQFRAIQSDMSALTRQPGHLTDSMKALFRIQTNQQLLESLMGGVRKYQNPALADLIESVAAESSGDIDKFERHLLEMADEKEQQFTVVDREAQRCRATLSRQPAEPARANRKTQ